MDTYTQYFTMAMFIASALMLILGPVYTIHCLKHGNLDQRLGYGMVSFVIGIGLLIVSITSY